MADSSETPSRAPATVAASLIALVTGHLSGRYEVVSVLGQGV